MNRALGTASALNAPGSLLWLLRHELRLAWRGIGGKRIWLLLILGGVLWVFVHLAAIGLLKALKFLSGDPERMTRVMAIMIAGGGLAFWVITTIKLSQTIAHSVAALFDRGDLDLLLSSPLAPRHVLTARALGIAIPTLIIPVLLLIPVANTALFMGLLHLLAIYPSTAAWALLAAAGGLIMTMSLVSLLGARRAKTAAQLLGAFMGAAFFLASQLPGWLGRPRQDQFNQWISSHIGADGMFGPESLLWLPARSFLGEPLPLLVFLLVCVGGFWLVVQVTHKRFTEGTQESLVGGRTRPRSDDGRAVKFHAGLARITIFKEWRLLWRDPRLISQVVLQVLYLLPLMFIGFRRPDNAHFVVMGCVFMAAMLAGNLAWLTIAAEDAPELVGTAPVALTRVRYYKAVAACIPVLAILVPLALYWLITHPWNGVVLLVCGVGATFSAALCHVWNPQKGDRRDMKARHKQGNIIISILEGMASLGWAVLAVGLASTWWWLIPVGLLLIPIGLGTAWIIGRPKRVLGLLA
ncbi:MAG: hypothetical protein JNM76_08715 [Betaproteobacteria bacterium]|nr:hypothetical protein [Betaproteobacteria bacterium]